MSKEMTIILLGVWTIILPYLGIPSSWRTILLVATGLVLVIVGFLLRGEFVARRRGGSRSSFVEHSPHHHAGQPSGQPHSSLVHEQSHHDHQEGISSLN